MPKFALLKDGVFQTTIEAEPGFDPGPGRTIEPFDAAVHVKPPKPAPTEKYITAYRFLFQLHTEAQTVALDAMHTEAMGLTSSELTSGDPNLMSAEGLPVAALRVLRIAYEMMDKLPGNVDLLSDDMAYFFSAAKALGVYGLDDAAADAEIDRIKAGTEPAS